MHYSEFLAAMVSSRIAMHPCCSAVKGPFGLGSEEQLSGMTSFFDRPSLALMLTQGCKPKDPQSDGKRASEVAQT